MATAYRDSKVSTHRRSALLLFDPLFVTALNPNYHPHVSMLQYQQERPVDLREGDNPKARTNILRLVQQRIKSLERECQARAR